MFTSESDETKATSSRSLRGSLSGPGQRWGEVVRWGHWFSYLTIRKRC